MRLHLDSLDKRQELRQSLLYDNDPARGFRLTDPNQSDDAYKQLLTKVEDQFWKKLAQSDTQKGQTNTFQLQQYFKRTKTTPYQLYVECTEIEKFSSQHAMNKALIEGNELKQYQTYLAYYQEANVGDLLRTSGLSRQLYNAFRDHYCSCQVDDQEGCTEGYCRLENFEYWTHKLAL